MQVTYYLDVLSSWCLWAEPAWDEVKARFAGRVVFDWRIALMNPADVPGSRAESAWYYRRSAAIMGSKVVLTPNWLEPERQGDYRAPNLVAEAGRDFGATDERLHRALARAGMIEGKRIGDLTVAAAVGAAVIGVPVDELQQHAVSDEVQRRVATSTAEFQAHCINQRPAFILKSEIGDKVVISGLATAGPLVAAIDAMLADAAGYAEHAARFGTPPV